MFGYIRFWYLFILTISVAYLKGHAQQVTPNFETISVNEGLSQSSVYSIHQDKKGYMWFGTSDGLNRFDGELVKVFKVKNPSMTIANSNHIRGKICEDRRGRIWYVNETGIYYFNPLTEVVQKAFGFLSTGTEELVYYSAIMIDEGETLWLRDPAKGLARYSLSTGQFQLVPFPPEIVKPFYIDDDQPLGKYIFLRFPKLNGSLRFDRVSEKYEWVFTDFPNIKIRAGKKKLFIVEGKRLSAFDSATQKIIPLPVVTESEIISVVEGGFDRIWISTFNSGLYCYFPKTKKYVSYQSDRSKSKSLPFNNTTSLLIDKTNNLWIGTDGGGVARLNINPPRFNIFPLNEGDYPVMKDYFIRAIQEDKLGRIWLGTLHNGLTIYNPVTGEIENYTKKHTDINGTHISTVSAIFRNDHGKTWVGHEGGISEFNEETKLFEPVTIKSMPLNDLADMTSYQITQLSDGDLMVCGSYGLIRIKKNNSGNYEGIPLTIAPFRVTNIAATTTGFWFSSPIFGLFYVQLEKEQYSIHKKFFAGIDIRSLHIDEQTPDILWVCSGSGLIRFNTKTEDYTLFSEEDGMLGSYVYGVLEDDDHNLWMSTNTGLCFFDRENETFQNFTFEDGLQSNEFNTGAFHKGSSGTLYFGGIKGINWFKTGAEKFKSSPPQLLVASVLVNDVPILSDSGFEHSNALSLSYNKNYLTFEMVVADYTRPEANRIKYKLDGWDDKWITSFAKSVRYSNLPPGDYTFHASASNGGNVWSDEKAIHIVIKSPFWRTKLFLSSLAIVLLGTVVGLTRSVARRKLNKKLQELEKQHAVMHERERMRKDIHDDLGSGLSKIAILSELAKQNAAQDDFTKRQLDKISLSSRELIDNLGELIWSNNASNDNLPKLLWYMREHLGGMFDGSNVAFRIELPEFIPDVQLQAEWRRNVFLIIKESLHNVLKHARASEVKIHVDVWKENLRITVEDNGRGFDVEKYSTGNGLTNIVNRANECNAIINIKSIPGKGTRIELKVPFSRA